MTTEKSKSKLEMIVAKDLMSEDVISIRPDMLIGQVAHLMLRHKVSGYPIVDELDKVVGIITLTDLFLVLDRTIYENGESAPQRILESKNRPCREIMSSNVICISPNTSLQEIINMVIKWKIHTFPVMENNKLVGIIGRHDVLNAAFSYA